MDALANLSDDNFRVAKPDQGATNYAAFLYAQPANSVGRNDSYYGAYAPDFRLDKH